MKYLKVYNKFQKDRRLFEAEQKLDDPAKADLVDKDVLEFYKTLEDAAKVPEGLKQQSQGGYTYQKTIETMQIGLRLLDYELPRFGVDGKYGPETAAAVKKFKEDNKTVVEKATESKVYKKFTNKSFISEAIELVTLSDLEEKDYDYVESDKDGTLNDQISKALLDDIELAAKNAGVKPKIHFGLHGHPSMGNPDSNSRHKRNIAVDISSIDGVYYGQNGFKEKGDKLKDELVKLGYTWNKESGETKAVLWQTNIGGDHFNHLHISNREGESGHVPVLPSVNYSDPGSVMEPTYLTQLSTLLKAKNINADDIKRFIDPKINTSGGIKISLEGTWLDIAFEYIASKERFSPTAKWDENKYRGGYGTDKILRNGQLLDADKNTTWTKEEAEATLKHQIEQFAGIIAGQLGKEHWEKLNDRQKASLVSLGYNAGPYFVNSFDYGKRIKQAIINDDFETAASEIANGPKSGSQSGYLAGLAKRRAEESQLFLA